MYTLVTGATGGLGRAFAHILASRGEALFLTGRSEEKLAALKEELAPFGAEILYCPCNLEEEGERAALFDRADRAGVRFSRLVYAAGADTQMAFEKYDEARIVFQTRANFEGAVSFCRAFLSRTPLDGTSELLFIGSVSGCSPMPYFALYSATKKALEQFLSGIRYELKGKAKVTCVLPGGMPTRPDIAENIRTHGFFGRISALPPEKVAAISLKGVRKNKKRVLPGFWNRTIAFFSALTPPPIRNRIIARMWGRTEKDHFSDSPQS